MSGRLLTPNEAADFLHVTARTLANLRYSGDGPKYYRISNNVIRYNEVDLIAWLESRRG